MGSNHFVQMNFSIQFCEKVISLMSWIICKIRGVNLMMFESLQGIITTMSRIILSSCCSVKKFTRENTEIGTQNTGWRFSEGFMDNTIHACPQSLKDMFKYYYSQPSTTYWIVSVTFRKAIFMILHIGMRENAEHIRKGKKKKKKRQKLFNRPLKRLHRGHNVKVWSMFLRDNARDWQWNTQYSYDFIKWRVYSGFQT